MDPLKPAEIDRYSQLLSMDPHEINSLRPEAIRLMASEAYLKQSNPDHKSLFPEKKIRSLFPSKER